MPQATASRMWSWKRHPAPRPGNDEARVLLVTGDEEYRGRWQKVFAGQGWELSSVPTLGQALETLSIRPFPVVVFDSHAGTEDWQDVLSALCERQDSPCVLLTSNVIDESFRDEIVRLHGYDVVSRNADEDEVVRTINSAWFWKHHHA
jgi:DNA-binding NtrC family response regulator